MDFTQKLRARSVVPVLSLDTIEEGVAVAKALVAGGLDILEITLRTPAALEIIRAVAAEIPQALVGAGTVLNAEQMQAAVKAGASFLVSPGSAEPLCKAAAQLSVPWIPGAATPSEVMNLRAQGIRLIKFFPAEASGGIAWLKACAPVFPDVTFMPTGGITPDTARDYLKLPNVAAVGGSWLAPKELVQQGRFSEITKLAREAD